MNKYHTISRTTDPSTSKAGAIEVTESGRRATQGERLLEIVTRQPGRTSGELRELADMTDTQVSRRMSDLKNLGLVHQGEPRAYKGRPHVTWWLGADPEQMKPKAHCSSCTCYEGLPATNIAEGQQPLF